MEQNKQKMEEMQIKVQLAYCGILFPRDIIWRIFCPVLNTNILKVISLIQQPTIESFLYIKATIKNVLAFSQDIKWATFHNSSRKLYCRTEL